MFRKLIFSIYFGEKNIFFTSKTNKHSRMLFRRNIVERIKTITPFFILDKDPYIVVTPKGLFWIQDAYTMSSLYPGSQPHDQGFNYIRNSVKIIVDAYNGTVDYYVAEPSDPIIQAYRRIYPGLLKNMEAMPEDFKAPCALSQGSVRHPTGYLPQISSDCGRILQTGGFLGIPGRGTE